jgi:hypothetical protein
VESEAAHAGVPIPSRDREELGDARQVSVEGGVEAGDLGHAREGLAECFEERDLAREVGRVERPRAAEFGDQVGGHELVVGEVDAAVDDAVSDPGEPRGAEPAADVGD